MEFTFTVVAGIPAQGKPEKDIFNKKTPVYPGIEFSLALWTKISFSFCLYQITTV